MKPLKTIAGYLLLAAALTAAGSANAAKIKTGTTPGGIPCIVISGEINNNDGRKFINAAEKMRRSRNSPKLVLLNSTGGMLAEAYEIAEYIHRNRMDTRVEGTKTCGSACFLIFASGTSRYADPASGMYVHRAMEYNRESSNAKAATLDLNSAYKRYGVPDKIRLAMLDTPGNKYYKLTPADIKSVNRGVPASYSGRHEVQRPAHQQPAPSHSSSQAATKERGISLIKDGYYDEGIKILEKETVRHPNDSRITFNLGFAYAQQGNTGKAMKYLKRTVKLDPDKAVAWSNLAEVQIKAGEIEEAADSFVYFYETAQDKEGARNKLFKILKENRGTPRAQAAAIAIDTLEL